MMTRPKHLLLLTLVVASMALYWGCEQPETILADKNQTVIHLEPERMPSTPYGMLYSLGVADDVVDDSVQGVTEIERFGYDWETRTFLDALGEPRVDTNRFVFSGDIYDYGYILVTVQKIRAFGSTADTVGPVMLIDEIQDPDDDPLLMVFPYMDTLTASQAFFHMKAVSDDDSWGDTSTATNGAAIWFSTVSWETETHRDTVELISYIIDSNWVDDFGEDRCFEGIVNISGYETPVEVTRVFGLDTIIGTAVHYDAETYLTCVDSGPPPYLKSNLDSLVWRVGLTNSEGEFIEDDSIRVSYNDHVQIGGYWKDLTRFGWKYRGWVVSSVIKEVNAGIGVITPPAWIAYNTDNDSIIRGFDGELLSTGTFVSLEEPDDGNPYIGSQHGVPPYPGEEFLHVPGAATNEVQLVPGGGRSTGTIFIAMHPSNALTDTTNFPLIVSTVDLPAYRGQVTAADQGHPKGVFDPYSYSLIGRAITDLPSSPAGPHLQGFPQIEVKFERR